MLLYHKNDRRYKQTYYDRFDVESSRDDGIESGHAQSMPTAGDTTTETNRRVSKHIWTGTRRHLRHTYAHSDPAHTSPAIAYSVSMVQPTQHGIPKVRWPTRFNTVRTVYDTFGQFQIDS